MILLGSALAFFNQFLGDFEVYDLSYYAVRSFLGIIGGLSILAGFLSIFLFVGLMMMKDWARIYSIVFFMTVFVMSIVLIIINFYVACTVISLVIAILCIFCVLYLRKANVIKLFESFELDVHKSHIISSESDKELTQDKILATKPEDIEVKVPENMMLCPQCNALNLKKDDFCKTCATELNPEELNPEEEITNAD